MVAGKFEDWRATDAEYDRLIHLAWPRNLRPDAEEQLDAIAPHFKFLQAVADSGIKDITVAGTCLEPYEGCYYAIAKKAIYNAAKLLPDVRLKWLRYFYVYGAGQRRDSLYQQLLGAIENKDTVFKMSHGQQIRDFISVGAAAHNTVSIAEQDKPGIYEIGSGKPQRVIDFAQRVLSSRENNYEMKLETEAYPVPAWEPPHFFADVKTLDQIDNVRFE